MWPLNDRGKSGRNLKIGYSNLLTRSSRLPHAVNFSLLQSLCSAFQHRFSLTIKKILLILKAYAATIPTLSLKSRKSTLSLPMMWDWTAWITPSSSWIFQTLKQMTTRKKFQKTRLRLSNSMFLTRKRASVTCSTRTRRSHKLSKKIHYCWNRVWLLQLSKWCSLRNKRTSLRLQNCWHWLDLPHSPLSPESQINQPDTPTVNSSSNLSSYRKKCKLSCAILCLSRNLLRRDTTKEAKLTVKEVAMEHSTTMREASTVEIGRIIRCMVRELCTTLMAE